MSEYPRFIKPWFSSYPLQMSEYSGLWNFIKIDFHPNCSNKWRAKWQNARAKCLKLCKNLFHNLVFVKCQCETDGRFYETTKLLLLSIPVSKTAEWNHHSSYQLISSNQVSRNTMSPWNPISCFEHTTLK